MLFEKTISLLIAAGMALSTGTAGMGVSEMPIEPIIDEETNAYLNPDPDPASEHYWAQQAAAIDYRFKVSLTPNCTIESFVLEPYYVNKSKTLIASVIIPVSELDAVFSDPTYHPDLRDFDFKFIPWGLVDEWELKEEAVDYYYDWFDDTGASTRGHIIVVMKEEDGLVRVYFWAPSHTILNSIEDLEHWLNPLA